MILQIFLFHCLKALRERGSARTVGSFSPASLQTRWPWI